jgi:hypothetical protein
MHIVSLLIAVALFSGCVTPVRTDSLPPAAQASPAPVTGRPLAPSEARAEFSDLYQSLQSAHYDLFAYRSREEYDRVFAATLEQIAAPATTLDLVRIFQPFVAYGDIGHSRIDFPVQEYRAAAGRNDRIIPVDLRFDGGRALIAHNYSDDPRLAPGTEVVALNGRPIQHERAAVARYVSGESEYLVNAQLDEMFPRWMWVDRGSVPSVTFEVRAASSDSVNAVTVPGMPIGEVETRKREWTTAAHRRELQLLDGGLAYLRPGPFYNTDGGDSMEVSSFRQFVDDSFEKLLRAGTTDLIVDLRNNPGGDNSFSDLVVSWIADRPFRFASEFRIKASPQTMAAYRSAAGGIAHQMHQAMAARENGDRFLFQIPFARPREGRRFHGRVFVIVNRYSFSNSASMAAVIQDYGFGQIMGEETADLPTSYASSVQFTLPRSGIPVTYPKSYLVRPSGDRSPRGVRPDFPIANQAPGGKGDPVLEEAIAIIRRASPETGRR